MPIGRQVESLRLALDRCEIFPYFQPVVDLKKGNVCGFEVLARVQHDDGSVTLPADLIARAEETGLLDEITERLLRCTGKLARTLPEHLRYAINITPRQFCHASFAEKLLRLCEEAGLPVAQVTLEITESALLDNFELALSISGRLREYGVRLALDDFGTGYSSLRHLQALPFDELKIDQSFVTSMSDRRASRKIVAATVGLGYSLGMTTVAEGIETKEQADMLFYLGCSRGQGWFFSPPLPASAVQEYLARSGGVEGSTAWHPSQVADAMATTLEVLPAQRLSQLQAIYDGAPAALCYLNRELCYVSLNKRFIEAAGRPIEEFLGRTVAEAQPTHFAEIEPYLLRALRGEATTEVEVVRPDPARPGQVKTYLVSYLPALDEVQEVIGISCVAVDITERKRVENALRASVEHYWQAVGTSPQISWTADPQGRVLDISPRWEIVSGMSFEDVMEGRWVKAIHEDDRERVAVWWKRSMRSGRPLDMLFRVVTKEGRTLWIRSSGAPRHGQDGTVLRWYGTLELVDARSGGGVAGRGGRSFATANDTPRSTPASKDARRGPRPSRR